MSPPFKSRIIGNVNLSYDDRNERGSYRQYRKEMALLAVAAVGERIAEFNRWLLCSVSAAPSIFDSDGTVTVQEPVQYKKHRRKTDT